MRDRRALTLPVLPRTLRTFMGTTRRTAPHSTFRTVALVVSAVATILFLLCVAAVVRYGDRVRDFGWRSGRADGMLVVGEVDPGGPADGCLQSGDEIVAWNGDRRVTRVGAAPFGRNLRRDADYTLTIRRAGVEQTVTLNAPPRANGDLRRLSVFEPGRRVCLVGRRHDDRALQARADGLSQRLRGGNGDGVLHAAGWRAWNALPGCPIGGEPRCSSSFPCTRCTWRSATTSTSRFPPGVSTTRLWRGIRIGLYVVCAVLFVFGELVDTVIDIVAPDRAGSVRDALLPIDRWLQWPAGLVLPLGGVAILAVVTRNYRAVQREDDRRRLRWVLWGTVLGLTPFLAVQIMPLRCGSPGTPVNFGRWNPVVNLGTVLIPISFGYAIIKHHVFDITFVVRRGLQYLLAKNALRLLLALPIAGLAYGVLVHRDQPIGQLLWTNSAYLYLIVAAIVSLRFRAQLTRWLDRRFFREAYDRQRILVELIDNVEKLESASECLEARQP